MERVGVLLCLLVATLAAGFVTDGKQQVRKKRQIMQDQPRLLTENGDLIFQCGNTKNIRFRPSPGGGVYIGADNLTYIAQIAKSNRDEIQSLKGSTGTPANIDNRLTSLETTVGTLQGVPAQLQTLTSNFNQVKSTVDSTNANNRLNTVESRLNNLQPTGQVQTTLNSLSSRMSSLEGRVNAISSTLGSDDNSGLRRKVQTLETTVQRLQQLLTTNECNSNPCQNGGSCVDTYNGFICQCPSNWQGTTCSADVNECSEYAGTDRGCQNGATCVNLQGSFRCDCAPNFYGILCSSATNDCSGNTHEALCGHGTCVNSPNTPGRANYRCICNGGWTTAPGGSDPACNTDVNECNSSRPVCSVDPRVPCINVPGTFHCGACPTGYTGNGFTCTDVNECEVNNGGCSLAPRVDCINTRGSFRCGPCPAGYQGNGQTCTFVGLCRQNNGGCHPLASCSENSGVLGVVCTCPDGYIGSGVGPNGCATGGGTSGSCASNPCQHGSCTVSGNSYTCSCNAGYTGRNCESDIDECNNNPCMNGGTCRNTQGSFTCLCTSDFSGPTCQNAQQGCGGYLTGEQGSFSYPRQGGNYSHSVSCAWQITTNTDKILMITFPRFSLEAHTQCNFDFLQIHDGPSASAHMIGKYCGNQSPNGGNINSTHNQLYLWFKSDASIASDGFTVSWTSADPVCGGTLNNGSYGTINSPGYPGNYPHNRDCVWVVSVPPGNNIMINFATLALENHPNCSYDFLEIRSGQLSSSPLLQRYCSTSTPAPATTVGPYAYVYLHTDGSLNDRGFHITYNAVAAGSGCGGALTGSDGTVTSPNYPSPYNHNAECVWTITVDPSDNVVLTFSAFNLEADNGCDYDYLQVYDGSDETAPSLGRLCGSQMPSTITASSNVLMLKFRTDSSVSGSGFSATWTSGCGGVFTALQGTIQSPSFPNAYPHSKTCNYLINVPDGKIVVLTFSNFSVEGGSCIYDHVSVYDGGNDQASRLGSRYCGTSLPPVQRSSTNMMYVRFVTDSSVSNTGFRATYTAEDAGCNRVLTAPEGNFSSPGHPNRYPHGANCTWHINVQPGMIITLTFSYFRLEGGSSCFYDSVSIYDDSNTQNSSRLLGRFCGTNVPPALTSTDNYMTVYFVADSNVAVEGFAASYTTSNATLACGATLTRPTGIITSPNYPDNYPHNRECIWNIRVANRRQIRLNFTNFQMESHSQCNYDYLEIRNGGAATSPLIGKFCGSLYTYPILRSIVSHSNRLRLKFVTDGSASATGFRVVYDGTATGCGGDLTTPNGEFASPNYPSPYTHRAECFWTISVSLGSSVLISFSDFDIESHSRCRFDYLELRENNAQGQRIGDRLCGEQVNLTVATNTSRVWIKFRTDSSVSGRGFRAQYTTDCNTRLTTYAGEIQSPNYPQPYDHSGDCSWVIDTTDGNTLNISFLAFDVESHSSCNYDYLELFDGENTGATSLGKFCGDSIPSPIFSTTDKVRVNFVTDSSVSGTGFRLQYITNGCGGFLTGPSGTFASPNYPDSYHHGRTCEWLITVNSSNSVKLTFNDFDVESSRDCNFDYVKVFAGSDDTGIELTTLCHSQTTAQTLTSTGNTMFIRMLTDSSVGGRGFNASWTQVPGGCGGNMSTLNGVIMSKNYPSNYPHNTECEWLITLPANHPIILNFMDFQLEGHRNCVYDYVDLYDGANTRATRLAHLCGGNMPGNTTYRSSTNVMFIKMRTDSSVSHRGFKANYTAGCGGRFNATVDGAIFSKNYPQDYPAYSNCTWLLYSDRNTDRITLTFTHMDIESSRSCNDDYVQVLNGNDADAPEIGRYCGNTIPPAITSSGSSLFVIFVSDFATQLTGFRATYTRSSGSCGGDFTNRTGAFVSPNYPNSYPANTECVWTVPTFPGSHVSLAFSQFNIESSAGCTNDYVEIRSEGPSGSLYGRYCGSSIPSNLTASSVPLWVKFRSDSANTGQGFRATYSNNYGGSFYGDSGQINSPNYPSNYPNNADVSWTITVSMGRQVRLTFSSLNLEVSGSCSYDYVRIRDGPSTSSASLGKFCGTSIPSSPVVSTSNVVRVQFHTDVSVTRSGFQLSWQATGSTASPPTSPAPGSTLAPVSGCGGNLAASSFIQTVQSPGYPDGYSHGLNCVWNIMAVRGHRIWVNISDINLESHGSCNFDSVTIYDGSSTSDTSLGRFCGRNPNSAPILSTGSALAIAFTTDTSVNMTGFRLQFKSACGGSFSGSSTGLIQSPGYPLNYPSNSNCTWTVRVTSGRTVGVRFNGTFQIPSSGGCGSDFVQLFNGGNTNSPPLLPNGTAATGTGKYCGSSAPASMETSGNFLTVNFVSDGSGTGSGFSMVFNEMTVTCGGTLQLTSQLTNGYFTSPNYPSNYDHNLDCFWVIRAPANERVQVDFVESFEIERHRNCRYDYVELRDGATSTAPLLEKFCGKTLPGSVYATSNVMYVRFRTDASVTKKGFKARYKIATCGGRITGQNGTITSPNYPSNYNANSNCTWQVYGPLGHYLTFTFDAFSLQSSSNCSNNDYVEVRDYNETGSLVLPRSCGSRIPASFDTSDSFAYIRFVSDGSSQSTGFSLSFQASVEECGGDLTTSTGTITSPNYPGVYAHARQCTWRITVQQGRRVKLTFNDVSMEASSVCAWDYVAVYNGILSDSPSITRVCGSTVPDPIESSSNTMKVMFRSDGSVSGRGFSATFTSQDEALCGGILTAPTNITSPGFYEHGNYSNSEQCIWRVQNPRRSGSSLRIRINHLGLERHPSCGWDFLEFREGSDQNGPIIEKFCGNNTIPDPVLVPTEQVFVRFRTDRSLVGTGFSATIDNTRCGGVLTSSSGVITSPNYPSNYDHNDNCVWKIVAPEGQRIRLTFTSFTVENHTNCGYDYLEIFNGGLPDSPSTGRYCSNNPPPNFVSQSNGLRLIFKTDGSESARGFRATYSFDSESCGGLFHNNNGSLSSRNYPSNYPPNTECVWDINVVNGYTIQLTVGSDFSLQGGTGCNRDYLEVKDVMSNGTQVLLGRYCSTTAPPVLISSSSRLLVKFHSDYSSSSTGFTANWTSVCGGTFTGRGGQILSPGYPETYGNNLRCNYTILGDPQHYIMLSFYSFELEGSSTCRFDYLQIFGGQNASATQLGKFCGTTVPQPVYSLGAMYMRFWTDNSVVRPGFKAMYRIEECGGIFTDPQGLIKTPTYPSPYAHDSNCTWKITVNSSKVVAIKFRSFKMEAGSGCRFDYLAVYDGDSLSSPLIGRYCGTQVPGIIKSTSNKMLLNLITDSTVSEDGFAGGYWSTYGPQHGCGGTLNQTSGTIQSFDADGNSFYEDGLDCQWVITVSANKIISLNFSSLTIEAGGAQCSFDYVAVYDGMSTNDPLIGKFCGSPSPLPRLLTTSNVVLVQFYTDFSIHMTGFRISYAQRDSICGGTLTATQAPQSLTSPGYPNAYNQAIRCSWFIDSGSSQRQVSLTMQNLSLAQDRSCSSEYVQFRDSTLGLYGKSVIYCGTTIPPTFDTVGRVAQVIYHLPGGSTSQGFRLTYAWADCNKDFVSASGRITSPGYPGNYPTNANCVVTVTAPAGTTLALYFTRFYIEPHSNCRFDYLQIRNGTNSSASLITNLCGRDIPDPVFISSNTAYLRFRTDTSVQHLGYDISFTSTTAGLGCGGRLTGINGSFTSPNFPGNYSSATDCVWRITVPARRLVRLTFTYLATPGQSDCQNNYVTVFNGPTSLSPQFGRYCDTIPANLTATTNSATVRLVSTGSSPAPSFRIIYTS